MSTLDVLVATHDTGLLLSWLGRGWALELSAEQTLQQVHDKVRWSYRFLDYSNGILDESSRLETLDATAEALRARPAEELAPCFEAVFHVAALEAWLVGDLASARTAAVKARAIHAARAEKANVNEMTFMARIAGEGATAITAGLAALLEQGQAHSHPLTRAAAAERQLLAVLAAADGREVPRPNWP